ncbi:prolyl oligopeptidase family serine peptidase [Candidatus Gottesmanbacteria bacterium]|nr:prolyl oligopeptidase family serine peptidase [Candidatus Gottesmanbacteria bacterium]
MKSKLFWVLIILLILQSSFIIYKFGIFNFAVLNPLAPSNLSPTPKPLEKYSFENLKNRSYPGSMIEFGQVLNNQSDFTSQMFYFTSDGKKVSGLITYPKNVKNASVIVLVRGFVDQTIYETGIGSKHVGEELAKNGFLTLAPDFLGYGESASPSADPIEERFETYTTVLNLLSSIKFLNRSFNNASLPISVNPGNVGIWGHSNGGHIALAALEISGASYPTVLWAPVSKPFPYSILYYTDEYEDLGRKLRKVVADFENDYDADKYSVTSYFNWINAPIIIQQGEADEAVPLKWSDELYKTLKKLQKDVSYFTYPGEDHNFSKGSWPAMVQKDIKFYQRNFNK